jgi:hypothetical protein
VPVQEKFCSQNDTGPSAYRYGSQNPRTSRSSSLLHRHEYFNWSYKPGICCSMCPGASGVGRSRFICDAPSEAEIRTVSSTSSRIMQLSNRKISASTYACFRGIRVEQRPSSECHPPDGILPLGGWQMRDGSTFRLCAIVPHLTVSVVQYYITLQPPAWQAYKRAA